MLKYGIMYIAQCITLHECIYEFTYNSNGGKKQKHLVIKDIQNFLSCPLKN